MPGRIAPDRLYAGSWWGRVKAGATPYPSFAFNERVPRQMLCQPRHISSTENTAFSIFCDLRTKSAKSTGSERIGARRAIFGLFPARPVNRSSPKTPGILPKSGGIGRGESACLMANGVGKGAGKAKLSGFREATRSSIRPSPNPSQIANNAWISASVTLPIRITSSPAPPLKLLDSPLPISMSLPAPPVMVMPEMPEAICSTST